jgi:hypothetical protein
MILVTNLLISEVGMSQYLDSEKAIAYLEDSFNKWASDRIEDFLS